MKILEAGHIGWMFFCPGCNVHHYVKEFNGDQENPTLYPDVMVRVGGQMCHSRVTNGKIQFLSDCTHRLVNQTVELPNLA